MSDKMQAESVHSHVQEHAADASKLAINMLQSEYGRMMLADSRIMKHVFEKMPPGDLGAFVEGMLSVGDVCTKFLATPEGRNFRQALCRHSHKYSTHPELGTTRDTVGLGTAERVAVDRGNGNRFMF